MLHRALLTSKYEVVVKGAVDYYASEAYAVFHLAQPLLLSWIIHSIVDFGFVTVGVRFVYLRQRSSQTQRTYGTRIMKNHCIRELT